MSELKCVRILKRIFILSFVIIFVLTSIHFDIKADIRTDKSILNAATALKATNGEYHPNMWYSGNGDAVSNPFAGYGLGPVWGHLNFEEKNGGVKISNSSNGDISVLRYSVGTDNRGGRGGIGINSNSYLYIKCISDVNFNIIIPFYNADGKQNYITLKQSSSGIITAHNVSKDEAFNSVNLIKSGRYDVKIPLFNALTDCGKAGISGIYSIDFVPQPLRGKNFSATFEKFEINSPQNIILGDVDCDYKVSVLDLVKLKKYICGNSILIDENAIDTNKDGKLDSSDLTELRKFIIFGNAPAVNPDPPPETDENPSWDGMVLGVNGHHRGYKSYPERNLESQIKLASQMGSKIYRFNFTPVNPGDWDYLDKAVNLCEKYNMDLFLIIYDWKFNPQDPAINYNALYNSTKRIAGRYRGRIKFYQLSNEQDIASMSQDSLGQQPQNYDYNYLSIAAECIRGMNDGIKAGDPDAKTSVNISYTHTYFLEYLIENGIKWDITGLDWYSNMNHANNSYTQMTMEHLLALPVNDIFISEINYWGKTTDRNQIDYFTEMYNFFKQYDRVKAFIPYELLDEPNLGGVENSFGLVHCDSNGNIGTEKPVFDHIKNLFR